MNFGTNALGQPLVGGNSNQYITQENQPARCVVPILNQPKTLVSDIYHKKGDTANRRIIMSCFNQTCGDTLAQLNVFLYTNYSRSQWKSIWKIQ